MTERPSGLFVTLEGGEGAGKSTQARILAESLTRSGVPVVTTREPGGTETAERLRALLLDPEVALDAMEQVLLFYAARHNHVDQVIKPALAAGKVVICDRFSDSTAAYQGAAGGVSADVVARIDDAVLGGFRPDATFLLDLPVDSGAQRVAQRAGATDRFEQAPTAFHQKLREAFLEIAALEPKRIRVIDARQPIDTIADRILEAIKVMLPAGAHSR